MSRQRDLKWERIRSWASGNGWSVASCLMTDHVTVVVHVGREVLGHGGFGPTSRMQSSLHRMEVPNGLTAEETWKLIRVKLKLAGFPGA